MFIYLCFNNNSHFKCTHLILKIVRIKLNLYIKYMFLLRMARKVKKKIKYGPLHKKVENPCSRLT
jgi:hypothetical protein